MITLPIIQKPNQRLSVNLGGQQCIIVIIQNSDGVYLTLNANNVAVIDNMICLDRVRLVRHAYLGFLGNLVFIDTQGTSDPDYTGFGTRYKLVYLPT